MSGDYIRGQKAYTKWDADAEQVDLVYRPCTTTDRPMHRHLNRGGILDTLSSWFSTNRSLVIKVSAILITFVIGIVLGCVIGNESHLECKSEHAGNAGNSCHHNQTISTPSSEIANPKIHIDDSEPIFNFDLNIVNKFQQAISSVQIQNHLRDFSKNIHTAGTDGSATVIGTIKDKWAKLGLGRVYHESFEVTLSYPDDSQTNSVVVTSAVTSAVAYQLKYQPNEEVKPYFAFSPDGSFTGPLIYANYGTRVDFQELVKLGVNLNGTVALVKIGKLHRANTIYIAGEYGIGAVLIYPDPTDNKNHKMFPEGLGLPDSVPVLGNVRLPNHRPNANLGVLSQPITLAHGNNLLKYVNATAIPPSWKLTLNATTNTDKFIAKVDVFNKLKKVNITNVFGVIQGSISSDDYIIIGCHHDAWYYGANDAGTGLAALTEIMSAISSLKGYHPSRTLIFAAWDAEEFGMIGSSEWVKAHSQELLRKAKAYINLDMAVTGNYTLNVLSSPLLWQAMREAAKNTPVEIKVEDVEHERVSTAYDLWMLHKMKVDYPGSGSDFVSFIQELGVPSLHAQIISEDANDGYPIYHTKHDTFDAVTKLRDKDLEQTTLLAKVIGALIIRLADSDYYPSNPAELGSALQAAFGTVSKNFKTVFDENGISLDKLKSSIDLLVKQISAHAHAVENNHGHHLEDFIALNEYNNRLIDLEKSFIFTDVQGNSTTNRHALYGPNPDNLYEGVLFPLIVESVSSAQNSKADSKTNWAGVQRAIDRTIECLTRATDTFRNGALIGPDPRQ